MCRNEIQNFDVFEKYINVIFQRFDIYVERVDVNLNILTFI